MYGGALGCFYYIFGGGGSSSAVMEVFVTRTTIFKHSNPNIMKSNHHEVQRIAPLKPPDPDLVPPVKQLHMEKE